MLEEQARAVARNCSSREEFDRRMRPVFRALSLHGYINTREARREARRIFHEVRRETARA